MQMKSLNVTGGAACGKTHFVSMLGEVLGNCSTVFSSDRDVSAQFANVSVQARLERVFGEVVLLPSGGINRSWLRERVMSEPFLRRKLEDVLHPLVLQSLEMAREAAWSAGKNLFLAEVPLHYEIGSTVSADFVIVVASSPSVQVRRMMQKRGLDEHTVQKFLQAQWPIEAKVERADAVIWNDGSLASLEAQVLTLASPLLQA